ncbi:MAG: mannose-1-phosphate guanylyltransferase [Chlamydiae bacterium]|nr:mannose-1-phosphate guanylyltransferase [Chlamydiota bacterium]
MKIIILAGGGGSRLWPISSKDFPKQFLTLMDNESLLQKTVKRFSNFCFLEELIVVTNVDYVPLVEEQLKFFKGNFKVLVEKEGKNTAPAAILGIKYLQENSKLKPTSKILVLPSDHLISPEHLFLAQLEELERQELDRMITFGVRPSKPETGYGYIQVGEKIEKNLFEVKKFEEKPDLKKAEQFLLEGNFLWNSGMFLFTKQIFFSELKKHCFEIFKLLEGSFDDVCENFEKMPNISLDYALMEKSKRLAVCPLEASWSDVGSWDSIYDVLSKDENDNVKIGDVLAIDTQNCLIMSKKRLISTIGLKDLLIVETDDAILLAKKGESQKVKDLLLKLQSRAKNKG